MGITFLENFNFPYMATSPKAFWKRWHISLSTWIRDYLYLPLTGKKVNNTNEKVAISEIRNSSSLKGYSALFITWAIMGFWHGANWTFIVWGLYHALLVTIHRVIAPLTKNINGSIKNILGWCISLPFLMLGWIPFRVTDITGVKNYFLKVVTPSSYTWMGLRENIYLITFIILLLIMASYFFIVFIRPRIKETLAGQLIEVSMFSGAVALVIIFLRPISQFIYFQF
jgi:D-alanyl-lipoteichoic acid acyltransferase DltB (MBOAT superfamily)